MQKHRRAQTHETLRIFCTSAHTQIRSKMVIRQSGRPAPATKMKVSDERGAEKELFSFDHQIATYHTPKPLQLACNVLLCISLCARLTVA